MALRFCDSFDHYDAAGTSKKYDSWGINGQSGVTSAAARLGSQGFRLINMDANHFFYKTMPDSQPTWIAGFAFRTTGYGDATLFSLHDAGSLQIELGMTSGSKLCVLRNGSVIATGPTSLSVNIWYYVEFKATINNTTGSYEVRINGVTELSASNVDTQTTANAYANNFGFGIGAGNGGQVDIDDFYLCDGTGSVNNDFLGDVRVEALTPNGNGNTSNMVGSDSNSTDNYLLLDESVPNDDTDYVQSVTVGDKDTYTFTNLTPTTGTVAGVQILNYARKTDAGARSMASVARHSGTEVDSASKILSNTYLYLHDVRETKPGGGAWSISDVNGAEFGMKVTV